MAVLSWCFVVRWLGGVDLNRGAVVVVVIPKHEVHNTTHMYDETAALFDQLLEWMGVLHMMRLAITVLLSVMHHQVLLLKCSLANAHRPTQKQAVCAQHNT
jgi:hypothetical protein